MTKANVLKIFRQYCNYWVNMFSLTDWDVKCIVIDDGDDNGNVLLNPDGRKALISLCKNHEDIVSIQEIALHECLEILFADIGLMLQVYYSKDKVDDEIHKVINRLMPVLMPLTNKN